MADGEGLVAQGNQLGKSGVTSSERWKQVEALFERTLEAPAAERTGFLRAIDDAELRREVESLLRAHEEAGAFLDQPDQFFSAESIEVDTLSPGQIIDRYRILREIGRGGMGAVFLAERADDEYKKQVALKLIKRGTDTNSVLRHFRNERQILAGFDHPNIARLFDGGTTDTGLPYFVMEYVDGLPIDEYCQTNALSVVERLKLFRDVCAAVSYAHRRLVIHRDIKRSNIVVTTEGVPKLLDFGIAKLLQEDDTPQATMTALQLMTPASASPEQLRGHPVTTATDVYSLGVVLYELLCGRSPYQFNTQSPHEMARVITDTEPKKPSTTVARESGNSKFEIRNSKLLKGDLDNIVLMALRKEPERRYQSVDQFAEDIRRHLEERPVLARKDTLDYRAAKFVRRNKAGVAAAALVLLSLIGGIVATSREAQIAKREQARAERRFNDVRKLANTVLFDYHDAIRDLPGATKVRERLVKDALEYLDSLASEAQGDPTLQRELAAAYERVGDVRGGTASGNLGDLAGAAESYTKALKIREALVAASPANTQDRRDLANSYNKVGYQFVERGDEKSGLPYLQKALALRLDLTREEPGNNEFQLELARTRNRLGYALKETDPIGALAQHHAALAVCEKLAASYPRERKYRRAVWTAYEFIARVLSLQNDTSGAIEANRKALAVGEVLLAEDPINAEYRRVLVLTYQHAGDYRERTDKRGALENFRRAVALDEGLLAADPANALTRKDLAYAYKKSADFLVDLEENSEALVYFRKALESYEKVATDAPADLVSRCLVVTCRAGVARMLARLGQTDSALEECRKAIAFLQAIREDAKGFVGKAQAYEYLGHGYVALAKSPPASSAESRERMIAARDMFRHALSILEEGRAQGTLEPANQAWAKEIAAELAKCDAALAK
jgi:tetratricopeptide (TPR) repeat protein/tRNA A-37 threonylcarbamoyl transferase component Bud32